MKKTGILFCLITMLNACTTATTEPTADLSPTETTMPPTTTPIPPTATDTATVRPQSIWDRNRLLLRDTFHTNSCCIRPRTFYPYCPVLKYVDSKKQQSGVGCLNIWDFNYGHLLAIFTVNVYEDCHFQ